MRLFICLAWLVCNSISVYAQSSARIKGKVIDSVSGKPVEYATVIVTDNATKKVINGAAADEKGTFEVTDLGAGSYTVSVEFIGYTRKSIDNVKINSGKDVVSLPTLLLSPSAA